MGLLNSVVTWFLKQRIDQIGQFVQNPVITQEEVFGKLLAKAKDTEWGKKYDYHTIKNVHDFKNRVPIQDYDDIKPYVTRIMEGEQNLLWPSEITWFAKSSGTTSDKSKFIPVTKEALEECHFKGGRDLMTIYCDNNPDTKIFSGKGLIMGGSTQVSKMSENSRYGDVSAVLMSNMPWLASLINTPGLDVSLIENYEEKIDRMARETIKKNVTHIAGVPTWTMVLINKIFEITGKDNLMDVWPNLELYIHGGVSFTPYREQFKKLIRGGQMRYMEAYNASEGFFGIQHNLLNPDLLLMLDYGIFYEFLPLEEMEKAQPKTLQLNDVEVGKNYALVISTNAGLWRYLIGDTIRFTSVYPFRIRVSGRTKHFINAFGEEVIVDNTDKAIALTCEKTGCLVNDYTAAPIYLEGKGKGGHEWIIEFDQPPKDLGHFVTLLDQHLQDLNSDYEAKRQSDLALKKPVVHAVEKGLFYDWLKFKGKLGGQNKVPRLSNDRKYVDDILRFMKKEN